MRWISLLTLISAACAAEVVPQTDPQAAPPSESVVYPCGDVSKLDPCEAAPVDVAKEAITLAACLAPVCQPAVPTGIMCPLPDGSMWVFGSSPNTIEHRTETTTLCRIVDGKVLNLQPYAATGS